MRVFISKIFGWGLKYFCICHPEKNIRVVVTEISAVSNSMRLKRNLKYTCLLIIIVSSSAVSKLNECTKTSFGQ